MSRTTNPKSLAQTISQSFSTFKKVRLRAIGASAVNQGVKAAIIARGLVATRGIDLVTKLGFENVQVPTGECTCVTLLIYPER